MINTSSISMCVSQLPTALESGCRSTWVRQAYDGKPTFHCLLLVRHISDSNCPRNCLPMHKQAACLCTLGVLLALLTTVG